MNLNVIKLGGSLMGAPELPRWLEQIESASEKHNYVIVPGGGKFADSIRNLQNQYQFNDATAHQMALLSMCQYGYYLKQINPNLDIINDDDLAKKVDKKSPLLWLPYNQIETDSELEASWDVTSDSIALWLASKLDAEKLVLVKSKHLANGRSEIKNHIKNNALDRAFLRYSENYCGNILFYSKSQFSEL